MGDGRRKEGKVFGVGTPACRAEAHLQDGFEL